MPTPVSGQAAASGEAQPGDSAPAAPAGGGETGTEAGAQAEGAPERPTLRLRLRRRRHRRPDAPGLLPGPAEPAAGSRGTAPGSASPDAAGGELPPGATPVVRSFRVPRRRRRHAPLSAAPAANLPDATAAGGNPGLDASRAEPGSRPARPRNRHRPREAGMPDQTGAPSGPRNRRGGGPRAPGERGDGPRLGAPRGDRRDAGPRANQRDGRRDRPSGRGRDAAPPRRAERKLYSFNSVVDRGFDDVEEEEAGTRRVHWTIVKRTTADQISRKPVSALYVVQRDGVDSEFPNLGAARNAVNKTIVHPEKLTCSKAEYAAEKK